MSIAKALKNLYPDAKPFIDYELQDDLDGQGIQIVRWDSQKLGPLPNIAGVDIDTAVIAEQAKEDAAAQIKIIKQTALQEFPFIKDFETLELAHELLLSTDEKNRTAGALKIIAAYQQAATEINALA